MVCNSVHRFLPVVGDTLLHGLQKFRALSLVAQVCRKTRPSLKNIMKCRPLEQVCSFLCGEWQGKGRAV